MAKVVAPLFGFSANGQLGKSIVNASWRGRQYVRRYVIPANPKTGAQTQVRTVFAWLQELWKRAPDNFALSWTAFSKGQPLTNRNAFTQANMKAMSQDNDLANFIFANGAKGGLAVSNVVAAPTLVAGQINVTFTLPTPPIGWSNGNVYLFALQDQDPTADVLYDMYSTQQANSPILITGLVSGALYRIGVMMQQSKPGGVPAYAPAVNVSATPL